MGCLGLGRFITTVICCEGTKGVPLVAGYGVSTRSVGWWCSMAVLLSLAHPNLPTWPVSIGIAWNWLLHLFSISRIGPTTTLLSLFVSEPFYSLSISCCNSARKLAPCPPSICV